MMMMIMIWVTMMMIMIRVTMMMWMVVMMIITVFVIKSFLPGAQFPSIALCYTAC